MLKRVLRKNTDVLCLPRKHKKGTSLNSKILLFLSRNLRTIIQCRAMYKAHVLEVVEVNQLLNALDVSNAIITV